MTKEKIWETRPLVPKPVEYFKRVQEIFESGFLTNQGKQAQEFEKSLEEFLEVGNALVFCNGTLALQLALQALDLKGEVITTPFTFPATTHAIVYNNLTPVFCDIEPEHFNLDPSKIEALITEKTSAILPVHIFGSPCQVDEIQEIANKYKLKVVYDAAHAFGVKIDGRPIGTFGDISMFSFHATKKFNTLEGGALTFKNNDLKGKLESLRNFGYQGDEVVCLGTNAKMDELRAAFGILLLDNLRMDIERRQALERLYDSLLFDCPGVSLRVERKGVESNAAYYVVLVEKRDDVYRRLQSEGIDARKRFYPLCSQFSCYRDLPSSQNLPVAEEISRQTLSLPLHSGLTEADIVRISDIIKMEVTKK